MNDRPNVLTMNHVYKAFPGVQALQDVSLSVRPGTVHALMGENGAGKSTLMKCLFGIYSMDSGEITLGGKPADIPNPKTALDLGISMIHQELHPVPHRPVMENIWLGRAPMKKVGPFSFLDCHTMESKTRELFKDLNMDIDPKKQIRHLSVSRIQSVEIAKAVSFNAKLIVMDEPSSSLTEDEVQHLFRIIRQLTARGIAIIYISHKIEEILQISDDVTIMRDGALVGTWPSSELSTDDIISRMVGRTITNRFPPRSNVPGEVIMDVDNYTSPYPRSFKNVSFQLKKGEILGVGGLVGAQRTELMEAVFGLRSISSGTLKLRGEEIDLSSPTKAKKEKMALLTEERRATGIFPVLSVQSNLVMANLEAYKGTMGLLNCSAMSKDTDEGIKKLSIKTPSRNTLIRSLSGGNQQKVLLARWLLIDPDILILDEPTRGIDVGAKYEIYTIMADLAKQGKSIIMISSELPELMGMSDRIMVMSEGRLAGILEGTKATEEEIMKLATLYVA